MDCAPVPPGLLAVLAMVVSAAACGARTGLERSAADAGAGVAEAQAPEAGPSGCGPATCTGCCDDDGLCQPGTAIDACGARGVKCQACNPSVDVCNPDGDPNVVGVVCYEPCPLRSCAGCCTTAGACVNGDVDTACGGPFRVCADCTAVGQVCRSAGAMRQCAKP